VLEDVMTATDALIGQVRPDKVELELFTFGGENDQLLARRELNSRPCGASNPQRQCVSELVDPVLAAGVNLAAVQLAFDQMLAAFEPSGAASDAFFAEWMRNSSQPDVECGFMAGQNFILGRVCGRFFKQLEQVYEDFMKQQPWLLVTQSQVDTMQARFRCDASPLLVFSPFCPQKGVLVRLRRVV
jgi:hypothetical protein